MAVTGRLLLMIFAYALASVAASFIFTLGALTPHWDDVSSAGLPPEAIWAIVAVGAPIIGFVAFLPALLIVTVAEAFGWRSVILYAAMGGALALALSYCSDLTGHVGEPATYFAREREVLAASGIAGGLVYWLIAGRKAGSWK
jgi:hypothetical protein